jgi:Rps23 Pro-64 3,4-dihydroxylase Tpa1-like proline 4-hydroxylase
MVPSFLSKLPGIRTSIALRRANDKIVALRAEVARVRAELQAEHAVVADLPAGAMRPVARERLGEILATLGERYRTAVPYPHVVIEDFLNPDLLSEVAREFAEMDHSGWRHTDGAHERKWSSEDERRFPPTTHALISYLNSGPFLGFLETLTGITGLIADPHLRGGGLHEIRRGGSLGVHADFNFYSRLKLYRRLNLLVYLNVGWQEEWGGKLELWDREGKACLESVAPLFNRAVLFETSNFSYHGHPHPLACPEDTARRSIALYYYTVDYPYPTDLAPHGTLFLDDPHDH